MPLRPPAPVLEAGVLVVVDACFESTRSIASDPSVAGQQQAKVVKLDLQPDTYLQAEANSKPTYVSRNREVGRRARTNTKTPTSLLQLWLTVIRTRGGTVLGDVFVAELWFLRLCCAS